MKKSMLVCLVTVLSGLACFAGDAGRIVEPSSTNHVVYIGEPATNYAGYAATWKFWNTRKPVRVAELVLVYSSAVTSDVSVVAIKNAVEYTRYSVSVTNESVVIWEPVEFWIDEGDRLVVTGTVDEASALLIDLAF